MPEFIDKRWFFRTRWDVSSQKIGNMSTADLEKNRLTRLTQFVPFLICCTHPEILKCYSVYLAWLKLDKIIRPRRLRFLGLGKP